VITGVVNSALPFFLFAYAAQTLLPADAPKQA